MAEIVVFDIRSAFFELERVLDVIKENDKLVREKMGKKLSEVFISFDEKPVASASVAQVHFAVLKGTEKYPEWQGKEVAIRNSFHIKPFLPWTEVILWWELFIEHHGDSYVPL